MKKSTFHNNNDDKYDTEFESESDEIDNPLATLDLKNSDSKLHKRFIPLIKEKPSSPFLSSQSFLPTFSFNTADFKIPTPRNKESSNSEKDKRGGNMFGKEDEKLSLIVQSKNKVANENQNVLTKEETKTEKFSTNHNANFHKRCIRRLNRLFTYNCVANNVHLQQQIKMLQIKITESKKQNIKSTVELSDDVKQIEKAIFVLDMYLYAPDMIYKFEKHQNNEDNSAEKDQQKITEGKNCIWKYQCVLLFMAFFGICSFIQNLFSKTKF